MELKVTKKGDPMVSVWFKIVAGNYTGKMLFYNQVIKLPFQLKILINFLNSLKTGINVTFGTYEELENLLDDFMNEINGRLEFSLDYRENNKGYETYTIKETFNINK